MLTDFIDSWTFFYATYLAGWLIAALLALVGVWVVAREQIFLGAAVSQASSLGIAASLFFTGAAGIDIMHAHGVGDLWLVSSAVAAAVLAAMLTGLGGRIGRESHEALTGWVFLVGMAGSVLLVAYSPYGADKIQRLLASTLIGATTFDIWSFAVLLVVTIATLVFAHRSLMLIALDPEMAAAVGLRHRLWNAAACAWLGLSVGLSMHVAGLLYCFGCLVLPALIARRLCRQTAACFVVAPLVAVAAAGVGFVLANHYDLPPAQVAVALLAAALPLAWGVQAARRADVR